jgi:hypothetical protein
MSNKNWQTILQVGCEGGCISLLGRKEKYDWTFTMTTDETSLRCFIHEEDLAGKLETKSHIEYSWEGALRLLEKYPHWPSLYPVAAHPEFVEQIITALRDKEAESSKKESYFGQIDWPRWVKTFIETSKKPDRPVLSRNSQIVGNIGMYYVCYHLSKLGWNVMPTARNARGVDIITYDENSINYLGIQIKTLSKRNPVPLGNSLDKIMGNYWVIVTLAGDNHTAYILTPEEVRNSAHRGEKDGKISYWLQPRSYDTEFYKEAWHRMEK